MPPAQKPRRSKQNYETPPGFIRAVKRRLKVAQFLIDVAADEHNTQAAYFFTEEDDALNCADWAAWTIPGWGWCNPPYTNISPWAERCLATKDAGGQIALLVPASVGANWYREFVHKKAVVYALNGRLHFMKDKPAWGYPKDCILALYSPVLPPKFDVWSWYQEL